VQIDYPPGAEVRRDNATRSIADIVSFWLAEQAGRQADFGLGHIEEDMVR
jgi:hypothetical protein